MSVIPLLIYPDPRLLQVCEAVGEINAAARQTARDLLDTHRAAPGVGLSAPQIGRFVRMVVIDPGRDRKTGAGNPRVLINPVIEHHTGERIFREGCLSVPEYTANVKRWDRVRARATDLEGNTLRWEAGDLESIVLQHEIDHLDGVLFIHRLLSLSELIPRKKK